MPKATAVRLAALVETFLRARLPQALDHGMGAVVSAFGRHRDEAEPGDLHLGASPSRQRIPCSEADDVGSPACPSQVSGRVKPVGNGSVGSRPIW